MNLYMKVKTHLPSFRAAALYLAVAMPILAIPASLRAATGPEAAPPTNRPAGPMHPASTNLFMALAPKFSAQPPDAEFFQAHIFNRALVPVGRTTPEENQALADALTRYLGRTNKEDQSLITGFLEKYPQSAWKPALLLNLGIAWRHDGYFSRAAGAWQEAWDSSKSASDINDRALADSNLGELVQLYAWVGDDRLGPLLAEVGNRPIVGGSEWTISRARNLRWMLDNQPDKLFKCGPEALRQILSATRTNADVSKLFETRASAQGFSLTRLQQLAVESGLNYQMAKRAPGGVIPPNSVIHWKLNHYGVVVRQDKDRCLVRDTTLADFYGPDMWVSQTALEEESDGYFLIPAGPLPAGWQTVSPEEGQKVFGKGASTIPDQNYFTDKDCLICEILAALDSSSSGMATYSAHLMLVNLHIVDTPVGYTPPVGPATEFTVTYNHKDYTSQANPNYSNLGLGWTFGWFSYVSDNGQNGYRGTPTRYAMNGGVIIHSNYDPYTGLYAPDIDGEVLQYDSVKDRYILTLPDGSEEIFAQPYSTTSSSRNMLLTTIQDPAGNTNGIFYDDLGRVFQVVDAIGQVTTLYYDLPGTYAQYKITRVQDPFNRTAYFQYDFDGRLIETTDTLGISSAFQYGNSSDLQFISQMTTPYGTSTFNYGEGVVKGSFPWLTLQDPNGDTEKLVYSASDSGPPYPEPTAEVPNSVSLWDLDPSGGGGGPGFANDGLSDRNTFYFDKNAYKMSNNGTDLTKATIYPDISHMV